MAAPREQPPIPPKAQQAANRTERSKIEAALREGEEQRRQLALIVEWSYDAIITKNIDSIITSWNKGAERVFGYAAEEAIGKSIMMLIPRHQHDEERIILERIRRGEQIGDYETVRQRKDGSLIAVSLSV